MKSIKSEKPAVVVAAQKQSVCSIVILIFVIATAFKSLLIPAYHSTDFEVHRNWLAITHSLPIEKWYHENTSEWTLDYPPFFAHFEYLLSQPAKFIDSEMLNVTNLNYKSSQTVHYQRATAIITELTLVFALLKYLRFFSLDKSKDSKDELVLLSPSVYLTVQFLINFGLIIVDNIHFQYNGFLYGIMILSMYCLQNNNWFLGSLLFSSLINLKHIYLYVAPAYFFYILFYYCLKGDTYMNKFVRLASIGIVALIPFGLSLGPFIVMNQIPQLLSRLFPFKRGLSHAYWAPNAWALYNFADKVASIAVGKSAKNSIMTSGLVQDIEHAVLPPIDPAVTFLLSFNFMILPIVIILYRDLVQGPASKPTNDPSKRNKYGNSYVLILLIVACAFSSFLFGWHVHEKAVLSILLPLSILPIVSSQSHEYASLYFFMSVVSHYSLFPLVFKQFEYPIKALLLLITSFYNYISLKYQFRNNFKLRSYEILFLSLIVALEFYNNCLQYVIGFDSRLPYLPLMLVSVYCSLGVLYSWARFFYIISF